MRILNRGWICGAALLLACPDPGGGTTASGSSSSGASTSTSTATGLTGDLPGCPDDNLEPNNVMADAIELGDGEFAAVICPLDVDFYALTVPTTTYLSVLAHLARDDGIIAIDLFEPEMGPLIQQSSGKQAIPAYPGRAIEAIHAKLQQSGTYLLRVTHSTGGDVPYRLVIQRFLDQTP